ncbi:MAG: hypothetical protein GY715_18140 [Planctomycetes bacterium]|nr:hypothetical protein [Planctomycetota bacterium]
MVLSHVCVECGHDLARVRVRREAHYGLPMVRCPNCDTVAVRRMHPAWRAWRRFLRVKTSLGVLLLQLAALKFFVGGGVGLCEWWLLLVADALDANAARPVEWALPIAVTLLFAVGLGTWLTAGFAHWRERFLPWLIYFLIVGAVLAVPRFIVPLIENGASGQITLLEEAAGWMVRLVGLMAMLVVAIIVGGYPGLLLERAVAGFRRWAWQARRRRLRARRRLHA